MDYMILEKIYWSQFRVVRFQHQLSDDSWDSLALPKIFVENVKDKLGVSAKLKTKNGSEWVVKLETCRNGDGFLTTGWKEFVQAHCLKKDDTVMFKHSGNFEFKVTMFDGKTGGENVFGHFVKNIEVRPRVVELEARNDMKECLARCKVERVESYDKECETLLPPEEEPLSADSQKSSQCPRKRPISEETTSCKVNSQTIRRTYKPWNKEQCLRRAKALEIAKSGDCMVYLCASSVKRPYVWYVPSKWVKKHKLDGLRAVELCIDGMTWPVKVFFRATGQAGIYLGRRFIEENGLQEGDVCFFTVIPGSTDPITINVRIVQVVKTAGDVLKANSEGNGYGSGWNFPETQNDLKESSKRCKIECIESSEKDHETVLPREEVPRDADRPNSCQFPRKRRRSKGTKKRQPMNRFDLLRKKEQCLRRAHALEVAKSGDYVAYISASYITHPYKLYVPVKWVKNHELDGARDVKLHINGMAWPVKVLVSETRETQAGIYIGRKLVEDNGLQEGDVCFFTVVPGSTDPIAINVRIVRGVKTADDVVKDSSDGNGNSSSFYFPEPENFEDSVPSYAYDQWF